MEKIEEFKDNTENQVKLQDVFFLTLKHWRWLILSLAICVGFATLYLLRTVPVYTRTATIVLRDDSKGKSALSSGLDAFEDMGLVQTKTNLRDEVNKLQSPDLMESVVRRLNLDMNYYVDGTFHKNNLYGSKLPVSVSFPSMIASESVTLTVTVSENGEISLSDIEVGEDEISLTKSSGIAFGDSVASPVGPIIVNKTPYYQPDTKYQIYVTKTPLKRTIEAYTKALHVMMKDDKSNTVELSITNNSIERADDVLNEIINSYNENWIDNRNIIAVSTSNFINERLRVIEQELGSVDKDISTFQSQNLIPDVQQAASIYMNENQAADAQILELGTQLQMARYVRNYLNDSSNRHQVLPANSGIGSAAIEKQIADYNEVVIERNHYVANSSEANPVVESLDSQLAGMRSAINTSIDNQITALETQIKNVQGSKGRTTALIAQNPAQANYLLSVERQQKVKESLYLFLLQKREENELSQAFTAYNTQVIMRPTGSDFPTSPRRMIILAGAFLIGLLIPFGYWFLTEMYNTKVRGRKDLDVISVPFLGEVPECKSSKKEVKGSDQIVVKEGARNVINEAFRVLRTNLGFVTAKQEGCTVIMVTSFNPGSGKTFLTMNVATSLAIKGKRVLVVDGDMRRGSTSEYVDSPKTGMSNYLIGGINNVHDVIVNGSINKNLDVLPVGTMPPNPTELIESTRFADMLKALRNEYDYIFIDCPPIEILADAQIVETLVDRTIFIVRAGLLERSMLPELEKIYQAKKFKNMSVILNATKSDISRYGSRYGYGYAYGYGYGNYRHYTSGDK